MGKFGSDGPLTLIFKIAVLGETKKSVGVVNQHPIIEDVLNHSATFDALSNNYHQGQLSQDFGLLFTSNEYADVTIVCGDKTFKCHKSKIYSNKLLLVIVSLNICLSYTEVILY